MSIMIMHDLKFNCFGTCIFAVAFELAVHINASFFTVFEIENMAPEILRCHSLYKWENDIVDARYQHPEENPVAKGNGIFVQC